MVRGTPIEWRHIAEKVAGYGQAQLLQSSKTFLPTNRYCQQLPTLYRSLGHRMNSFEWPKEASKQASEQARRQAKKQARKQSAPLDTKPNLESFLKMLLVASGTESDRLNFILK
eukprot:4542610-Amphidinium_carterae.1